MSVAARAGVETLLGRIEALVQTLASGKDPHARQAAHDLLQAALDLHGLALAKIAALLSASEEGREIYAGLGRDEQVKAVLLLHNLHPESAEDRIRAAVAELERRLGGTEIRLLSVSDGIARLSVDPGPREWEDLCREIGGTLIDAAPDLDDIAIDRMASADAVLAAAAE